MSFDVDIILIQRFFELAVNFRSIEEVRVDQHTRDGGKRKIVQRANALPKKRGEYALSFVKIEEKLIENASCAIDAAGG